MTRFIFQDGLHSSYWLVECDSYALQDRIVHCDNTDIASFINFSGLAINEFLRLTRRDTYKVIEEYRSLSGLLVDTTLLAV